MVRHFLRDDDLTADEQAQILARAAQLKKDRFASSVLAGPRSVALIFDKPTLRTQLSFSTGVVELGGYPMVVDGNLAQIGVRETIPDVGRVIGRQVAAIVWRTFAQSRLEELTGFVDVPVVNALTDDFHPCQILADLLTIQEHKGALAGLSMTYVGDCANNMAASYLLGGALAGMHVRLAGPADHQPGADIVSRATRLAGDTGGSIQIGTDPLTAVRDADVVVTDTWVSMGMEAQTASRKGQASPFAPYALTAELMVHAEPSAIVMHCLPAYRGYEIAAEVIDGPQSVVWDEAENRLHAQKALLEFLLEQS